MRVVQGRGQILVRLGIVPQREGPQRRGPHLQIRVAPQVRGLDRQTTLASGRPGVDRLQPDRRREALQGLCQPAIAGRIDVPGQAAGQFRVQLRDDPAAAVGRGLAILVDQLADQAAGRRLANLA